MSRLYSVGASVVVGDISPTSADEVVSSLESAKGAATGGNVDFLHCNVTDYADNYRLFKAAYDKYRRIDHAVSCAGILEQGKWFDPDLTIESVGKEEATRVVLDVNLPGSCVFARTAVVFLRDGIQKGENKSITLLSSGGFPRKSRLVYVSGKSHPNTLCGVVVEISFLLGLETRHIEPHALDAEDNS